jgi:hypothetical protein
MLKLPHSGGTPDMLSSLESYPQYGTGSIEIADGRILLPALIEGRPRLLLGKPGGSFVSLLEGNKDAAPPTVQLGNDQMALMVGGPSARTLAIASIKEGRIIRRFESTKGKVVWSVAASPDGKTLYYASSEAIWSVPTLGGSPRKICAGNTMAVDPNGRYLVVNLLEQSYARLERVPLTGGTPEPIHVTGDLPISHTLLDPGAVNKDGKLPISLAPRDSWFYGLGILDLATGKLSQVPLKYAGDVDSGGWGSDGDILATGYPMRAHIWRFRPTH